MQRGSGVIRSRAEIEAMGRQRRESSAECLVLPPLFGTSVDSSSIPEKLARAEAPTVTGEIWIDSECDAYKRTEIYNFRQYSLLSFPL